MQTIIYSYIYYKQRTCKTFIVITKKRKVVTCLCLLLQVILENRPCWLYFDLEFSKEANPSLDPTVVMEAFRGSIGDRLDRFRRSHSTALLSDAGCFAGCFVEVSEQKVPSMYDVLHILQFYCPSFLKCSIVSTVSTHVNPERNSLCLLPRKAGHVIGLLQHGGARIIH